MPIIDLKNTDIRVAKAYAWAIMNYPEDVEKAMSFAMSTALLCFSEYECEKCHSHKDCDTCEAYTDLIACIIRAIGRPIRLHDVLFSKQRNPMHLTPEIRFWNGHISGDILLSVLRHNESVTSAIRRIFIEQVPNMIEIDIIDKNFTEANLYNNVWNKFKNVSHLWAVFHQFEPIEDCDRSVENCEFQFISQQLRDLGKPDTFRAFTIRAELLRRVCIGKTPRRTGPGKPILDPETSYSILPPTKEAPDQKTK